MTVHKHTVRSFSLAAALLVVAGCASTGTDGNPAPTATPAPTSTAALVTVAQTYQDAVNRGDWRTACTLSSALLRGGTVADCVTTNTTPPPATTPPPSTPTRPAPAQPPTGTDSTTPEAPPSPTPSATGPATAGKVIKLPAGLDAHPAGYGVFITFEVSTTGKHYHRALRLVEEGGAWVVDQYEEFITSEGRLERVLQRR
ncbi:hypothetical protein ACFVFS_14230 [Kitasatospora sp. NPDC057692]|uniref:hypothetical protein n=1 Tax=Kitasatospora sp. NPDC057692 TaxID=3346215 RepID=UPI00369DF47C